MKNLNKMPLKRVLVQWPLMALLLLLPTSGFAQWNLDFFVPHSLAFAGKSKKTLSKAGEKRKKPKKKTTQSNLKKENSDPFYNSKLLEKIYKRQAKRMKSIDAYKKKGIIGEADNALLKIRDSRSLSGKAKALMEKVVKIENSDRQRIIQEIEKGVMRTDKRKTFVRRRLFEMYRKTDPRGTYFYQADHWNKK